MYVFIPGYPRQTVGNPVYNPNNRQTQAVLAAQRGERPMDDNERSIMKANIEQLQEQASVMTQCLCTLLHKHGWDEVFITMDDMRATHADNGFRVEVVRQEEMDRVIVALHKFTEEEKAARDEEPVKEDTRDNAGLHAQLEKRGFNVPAEVIAGWTPLQWLIAEKHAFGDIETVPDILSDFVVE